MKIKLRLGEKEIWRTANAGLLVGIGMFVGGPFFGLEPFYFAYVFTVAAELAILTIFSLAAVRGRILCLAGGLGSLICIGTIAGGDKCISFFRSYLHFLMGDTLWPGELAVWYGVIQAIILTVLCYLLAWVMEKDFRLKAAAAATLLFIMLYCLFTQKNISQLGMVFLIGYVAVIYTEWTQIRWEKSGGKSRQAYMLWVMPFLTAYLLLMAFMPAPEKPYAWRIVKDTYQHMKEFFIELTQSIFHSWQEEYDMSLSGFSEEGGLGGSFMESNKEIMTIYAPNGLKTNVYLIGKVYDTFDGKQWKQLNRDTSKERLMDTAETLYAAQRYDSQFLADYLHPVNLTITYRYFNTAFLFAPLKTAALMRDMDYLEFTQMGGSLFFDKKKGYGTEYEVTFYQINEGQEVFYQFLEAQQQEDKELLREVLANLERRTGEWVDEEDMEHYRQVIYEYYLSDVNLSEEVLKYLEKITEDARTEVEKLRAIEAELSTYTYSREIGELPESVMDEGSFLEYFLLESRKGYCNYFATAFVLLARAEGIPARYVQGFCVPSLGRGETVVYAYMAHAWPEVYLDGVGWIPFEPTPGYHAVRYTPWSLKNRNSGQSGRENRKKEPDREKIMEKEEAGQIKEGANVVHRWKDVGKSWGMAAASALGIVLLLWLLGQWIGKWRYRKMPEEGKFKLEVERNLQILAWMGLQRAPGETLEEFKNRVEESSYKGFVEFIGSYEEFLYGNKGVGQDTLAEIKRQQEELEKMLKEKRRWVYVYYRIMGVWQ